MHDIQPRSAPPTVLSKLPLIQREDVDVDELNLHFFERKMAEEKESPKFAPDDTSQPEDGADKANIPKFGDKVEDINTPLDNIPRDTIDGSQTQATESSNRVSIMGENDSSSEIATNKNNSPSKTFSRNDGFQQQKKEFAAGEIMGIAMLASCVILGLALLYTRRIGQRKRSVDITNEGLIRLQSSTRRNFAAKSSIPENEVATFPHIGNQLV